jgi:hypothetical protein
MTRGQQFVLFIIILMLLGVTVLLAITLFTSDDSATSVPTLAVIDVATALPTLPPGDTATPFTVPPTWTPEPTRTPRFTGTPRPTHTATAPPTISPTFAPTFTPRPTEVVTPSLPGPTTTVGLQNPGFEDVRGNTIPGWNWWAEDNFDPGGDYNPDTSFDTPLFKQADDSVRFIDGPTLQIDAVQHLKFKVNIFQTVPVSPTSRVDFQVMVGAFSDSGVIKLAAGLDPLGGSDCSKARWSDFLLLDQEGGVQTIVAPGVAAGEAGLVTVCLYAEPLYAAISNAAFFDNAELTIDTD